MRKKIILLFLVVLLFLFVYLANRDFDNFYEVCFDINCVLVDIADSEFERAQGLMNRTSTPLDGMIFIFDKEDYYSFWMKNTLIALDIIWINADKEIVYIKEEVLPCKKLLEKFSSKNNCELFTSDKKAKYVLEINSGKVKEFNIKLGGKVKLIKV